MANHTEMSLANALGTLLEKKYLDKIRISEITDIAGISRQTFYYHFSDIYELFRWCLKRRFKMLSNKFATVDGSDMILIIYDEMLKERTKIIHAYKSMDHTEIKKAMHEMLDDNVKMQIRRKAKGRLDEERIDFIVRTFTSSLIGLFMEWLDRDLEDRQRRYVARLADISGKSLENLIDAMATSND